MQSKGMRKQRPRHRTKPHMDKLDPIIQLLSRTTALLDHPSMTPRSIQRDCLCQLPTRSNQTQALIVKRRGPYTLSYLTIPMSHRNIPNHHHGSVMKVMTHQ